MLRRHLLDERGLKRVENALHFWLTHQPGVR
jgi:hypothetical protein